MKRKEAKERDRASKVLMREAILLATDKIADEIKSYGDDNFNKRQAEAIYYLSAAFQLME